MFRFRSGKTLGVERVLKIRKCINSYLEENFADFKTDKSFFLKNVTIFLEELPKLYSYLTNNCSDFPKEIDYRTFYETAELQYDICIRSFSL